MTKLTLEDRVHMVEWNRHLHLAWYVVSSCGELYPEDVTNYRGDFSVTVGGDGLYPAVTRRRSHGKF